MLHVLISMVHVNYAIVYTYAITVVIVVLKRQTDCQLQRDAMSWYIRHQIWAPQPSRSGGIN